MFKFLTKNKKGFTLIELMAILLLLSLGVVALGNMFKVTYRAFNKAEERYIKQEEVKLVAEMLRKGSSNIASSNYADIFDTTQVIPTVGVDASFSFLYFEPHYICSVCGDNWKKTSEDSVGVCPKKCENAESKVDGYFLKCLNRGTGRSCDLQYKVCDDHCKCPNTTTEHYCRDCDKCSCTEKAVQLSNVPIYVTFKPLMEKFDKVNGVIYDPITKETVYDEGTEEINSCGVIITLAALEEDFVYESKDASGKTVLNSPVSDDIYYSVDVAYHFPNMVLSPVGARINYSDKSEKSVADVYNEKGRIVKSKEEVPKIVVVNGKETTVYTTYYTYKQVEATPDGVPGNVLRIQADSIITRDTANSKLKTPALCFIATASHGRDSSEVGLLCDFRDKCLLTNPIGTAFVKAYYKLSPPIAEFIADSEPLKAAVRVALKPLVAIATNALDDDVATENAPWFIMFMLCGAGATATLIKVDKRRKKAKE